MNDIECSVLGCLMLDNSICRHIPELSEDDFTDEANKRIYSAMCTLYENKTPIDIITLLEELKSRKAVESAGGLDYLTALSKYVPTTANFEHYLAALKNSTRKRKMLQAFRDAHKDMQSGLTVEEARLNVMQALSALAPENAHEDESLKAVLLDTYGDLQERFANRDNDKSHTGLADFDSFTGGLMRGELTILAARPGVGKTALALQIALYWAQNGNKVLFVSREMSREQLGIRIYAHSAPMDGRILRKGNLTEYEWEGVKRVMRELANAPLYINNAAATPLQIREACRARKEQTGLDLLIIDYLQLLNGDGKYSNRHEEVADISRRIKDLTMEFNIPVLALSQLNREGDGREPQLSNLKESGSIEQDADNVVFLHRPTEKELKGIAAQEADETARAGNVYVRCILAKMRQSEAGMFPLVYIPKHLKFACLVREQKREYKPPQQTKWYRQYQD